MATLLVRPSLLSIYVIIFLPAFLAQSIPSVLPGNWTSLGCYTDISTARTLAATSTTSDSMTVESCISFCETSGYIYAGVEFSNCDSTIQNPGQPTALSDCSFGCSGNSSESCGASGKLNLLYSGQPGPVFVQTTSDGQWTYQGCLTDSISQRTLAVPNPIPVGVTADSCTAACKSLGGYQFAGMENGHECWCGDSLNAASQRVSDDDCRMVCVADHSEYCGNQDRIATYRFSASEEPQTCTSTDVANFTLQAVYKNPDAGGPTSVKLKLITVEMVPNIVWGILTACSTCCSEWPFYSLTNSVFFPRAPSNPSLRASSTAPQDGESPSFISSNPPFPGAQEYCVVDDPAAAAGSLPLLSFGGKTDAFSLCSNSSANGRLDVVYSPVTGHPHYSLDGCSPISIQVISG